MIRMLEITNSPCPRMICVEALLYSSPEKSNTRIWFSAISQGFVPSLKYIGQRSTVKEKKIVDV